MSDVELSYRMSLPEVASAVMRVVFGQVGMWFAMCFLYTPFLVAILPFVGLDLLAVVTRRQTPEPMIWGTFSFLVLFFPTIALVVYWLVYRECRKHQCALGTVSCTILENELRFRSDASGVYGLAQLPTYAEMASGILLSGRFFGPFVLVPRSAVPREAFSILLERLQSKRLTKPMLATPGMWIGGLLVGMLVGGLLFGAQIWYAMR